MLYCNVFDPLKMKIFHKARLGKLFFGNLLTVSVGQMVNINMIFVACLLFFHQYKIQDTINIR